LEQAAAPGEVLLGEPVYRLARVAIEVERVEPLALKGKSSPLPAHRLLAASGFRPPRSGGASLAGRERELALLRREFASTVSRRGCRLVTLVGEAGVGKTRVAAEFCDRIQHGAWLVRGSCLSYGEGITYFPVVEVVRQLGDARRALLAEQPDAAAVLGGLLGEAPTATTADEIAWAVRRLLEVAARERPLVVLFDDVHWGEPTFFDLVQHIVDLAREAPILLLCLARPELLELRPGWGGGRRNTRTMALEPLSPEDTDALIKRLLSGEELDAALGDRIRAAAQGNPLFLEEMLALVGESAGGEVTVLRRARRSATAGPTRAPDPARRVRHRAPATAREAVRVRRQPRAALPRLP